MRWRCDGDVCSGREACPGWVSSSARGQAFCPLGKADPMSPLCPLPSLSLSPLPPSPHPPCAYRTDLFNKAPGLADAFSADKAGGYPCNRNTASVPRLPAGLTAGCVVALSQRGGGVQTRQHETAVWLRVIQRVQRCIRCPAGWGGEALSSYRSKQTPTTPSVLRNNVSQY